jgi:ABC-type transporter Mla MlaB component
LHNYILKLDQNGRFVLSGDINLSTASAIKSDGISQFKNYNSIELELRNVDNFDSSLITILLAWQRHLIRKNIVFAISISQQSISMLLNSYKVQDLFSYFD